MKIKMKQNMVFIVAAVLVVDFALFGYGPSMQRLKKLKHSQETYHKLKSNSLTQREKLITLKRQSKTQQEVLAQWKHRIPRTRDIGPFVETVAQLMSRHDLIDQCVEPGQERQVNQLGMVSLHLRCRGELDQLYSFYRDLQKQPRLIRIQQLRLHQVTPSNKGIEMDTKVMLFYGEPEASVSQTNDRTDTQKS